MIAGSALLSAGQADRAILSSVIKSALRATFRSCKPCAIRLRLETHAHNAVMHLYLLGPGELHVGAVNELRGQPVYQKLRRCFSAPKRSPRSFIKFLAPNLAFPASASCNADNAVPAGLLNYPQQICFWVAWIGFLTLIWFAASFCVVDPEKLAAPIAIVDFDMGDAPIIVRILAHRSEEDRLQWALVLIKEDIRRTLVRG
jgi:hypothetical protein